MKKVRLRLGKVLVWPAALATIFMSSVIIIISPVGDKTLISLPTPTPSRYVCPATDWVNCMPGPDQPHNLQCQPAFLDWAKANCPGFQGAAL